MAEVFKKTDNSFKWFNAAQFLGALNDNIFKLLVIFFLIGIQGDRSAAKVTSLASILFVVPFLIFMAYAGKLADRYSKSSIVVWTKFAEIVIMLAGLAAFLLHSQLGLYSVLVLMAAQSAFFGPAKYGILPELVEHQNLSKANGFLEAFTYLAIVIGTAAGPFLSQLAGENFALASVGCVVIAVLGFAASLRIRKTAAVGGDVRSSVFFGKDIWRTLTEISRDKDLLLAVGASAYFLLIGGFIYVNLIPYGMSHLGLSKTESAYLFVITAAGIGAGSIWAGRLSGRDVEFGIVPLGAVGLTISSIGLSFVPHFYVMIFFVFIMGVSSGLFIVPIQTFIQFRSPVARRGQILAASNFLGWLGVLIAGALIYILNGIFKLSASQMFLVLGLLALVPAIGTIFMLPDFLARFIAVMLTRFCYKIKVVGADNVPVSGAAMLVSNHVSYVDAFLLLAAGQRRIRFVIEKKYYKKWWILPFVKLMRAIPISASDPPRQLIESFQLAGKALDEGFLVCIFAEGIMTRSGMMAGFKAGFERIMRGRTAPIIPVYLGGVWGSIFSYYGGRPLSMIPKDFPYPLTIHFGKPLAADTSAYIVRQKVSELSCDYFNGMKSPGRSLGYQFVKASRKNWRKKAIADSTGKLLNYGTTLTASLVLGERLSQITSRGEKIGVILPPSAGASIANLSLVLAERIPVNLNFTAGQDSMNCAIEQCGIRYVLSSRKFAEKVQMNFTSDKIIYLEDILAAVTKKEKIAAYLKARFWPLSLLVRPLRYGGDELATIIFSSGSAGKPKGVMLSHHNIISNIEGVRMVIMIRRGDDLCGALPFYHSFGLTCGCWMPLTSGVSVSYIANPLDAAAVAKSVRENRSTMMFAPPTFLSNYLRRARREDFTSLRIVVGGAEKLKPKLIDAFDEKFGIRPTEGFGATELSPVVSLNIPDVSMNDVTQIGTKEGTVGHPLPGVAAMVVDIDTAQPLGAEQQGLLMIKGPNVMLGYLNDPQRTASVIRDGWYNTGDIAKIDADGFITITDRLSRFSKIGGEMVPHGVIEQVLNDALAATEPVVAVTAVECEKKGEELVVFYVGSACDADKLYDIVAKSGLPNIAKPRRENFIEIDAMPVLGSGKINFGKLKEIAAIKKNV